MSFDTHFLIQIINVKTLYKLRRKWIEDILGLRTQLLMQKKLVVEVSTKNVFFFFYKLAREHKKIK